MSNCQHSCSCHLSNGPSVHQTLDELEFERGIWSAAQSGELDRVEMLIRRGTHPNDCDKGGYTALHYAARNGHLEVCKLLLQYGACINAVTRAGSATALHRACTAGQYNIVKFLLSKEANIELQDSDGKTALHRAAEMGHENIYKLLEQYLKNSLIYTCKDNKGNLPLLDNHNGKILNNI